MLVAGYRQRLPIPLQPKPNRYPVMARKDQETPFDENSFRSSVEDDEYFDAVARDIYTGYARDVIESEQRAIRQATHTAKLEHACREGWNEAPEFIETSLESFWYWVAKEGRECWDDNQFRKEYLRDNPWARRKNTTGRTLITAGTPWAPGALLVVS